MASRRGAELGVNSREGKALNHHVEGRELGLDSSAHPKVCLGNA